MAWAYQREESEVGFAPIPVGDYRVRIAKAEMTVSSNGNNMISLQLDVSGTRKKLFDNIVELKDRMEITNRNLTQFFDSFKGIPEGSFAVESWVGQAGAVHVKHEEWRGETQARVAWYIPSAKQDELPPWQEPEGSSGAPQPAPKTDADGFMNILEGLGEELPFD